MNADDTGRMKLRLSIDVLSCESMWNFLGATRVTFFRNRRMPEREPASTPVFGVADSRPEIS